MATTTTDPLYRRGIACALVAYTLWGVFPILWKWIRAVPAAEILAHRILGSFLLLALLAYFLRRGTAVRAMLRSRRALAFLFLSGGLITANWVTYVYAVNTDRLLEASLGYFINPLVNTALGVWLLREQLRPAQKGALALAALGVGWLIVKGGGVPWLGLFMCATFAGYGLARKFFNAETITASFLESGFFALPAILYLGFLARGGEAVSFQSGGAFLGLVIGVALVSATPLVFFAEAARTLPLSTLGFFQYISPSLQFLLAVVAFHEPLGMSRFAAFACIWAALAIYSWDLRRAGRRAAQ